MSGVFEKVFGRRRRANIAAAWAIKAITEALDELERLYVEQRDKGKSGRVPYSKSFSPTDGSIPAVTVEVRTLDIHAVQVTAHCPSHSARRQLQHMVAALWLIDNIFPKGRKLEAYIRPYSGSRMDRVRRLAGAGNHASN